MVFQRSMLDWGVSLPEVSVHYAICETYLVQWSFRDLWSIGGGGMGPVCTGVVVFHRSMVNWRRGWGSVCTGICSFFYM